MNEIGRKIADKIIELHGSTEFKVAFLPYKRSMWNSMESVYEELKASGVEVHCMPIPYLRLKTYKHPDYLDTDFFLFGDIAERYEDLDGMNIDYACIHYQYEDHNKVTNMIPKFFTKAIKERYNCKIIFLPYGIYGNQQRYSLQPGCRDIDYAFLESEDAVNLFITGWQTQGVDFTGRVFSYGSPKLDMAGKLKKDVPEEWADKIGNRSVTLICNSLGPFLEDPRRKIELYRYHIMNEIGIGRAVIFRPHPLLAQTIKSMRPDISDCYQQFTLWADDMDHCIVDQSEYLEQAFGIADRMISDASSVVPMWQGTGKPVEVMG